MSSINHLSTLYKEAKTQWHTSPQSTLTTTFFKTHIHPLRTLKISQAICIGLGSLTSSSIGPYPQGKNSMSQFVAFEHFLSLIAESNLNAFEGEENEVFFQDPGSIAFTDLDREFIRSKGYSVLEPEEGEIISHYSRLGQAAQGMIKEGGKGKETFLFAPVGNDKLPLVECLGDKYPGLLIGSKIEQTDMGVSKCGQWTLDSVKKGSYGHTKEVARRKTVWPFYNSHVTSSLWLWEEKGMGKDWRDQQRKQAFEKGLEWTWDVWVSWVPDGVEGLVVRDIEEEVDCQCPFCRWEKGVEREKGKKKPGKGNPDTPEPPPTPDSLPRYYSYSLGG